MSLTISCPSCQRPLRVPESLLGQAVKCPSCMTIFTAPDPVEEAAPPRHPDPPPPVAEVADEPRPSPRRRGRNEKYCVECGSLIRARAELCPNCGVRQPYEEEGYPRRPSRDGVRIPLLISAISNIVVGLLWASSCFGIVFTVPMAILCIFEFKLWSKADTLPLHVFRRKASTLGIFEILVGLANTPTLICGIIILINSSKIGGPQDYE